MRKDLHIIIGGPTIDEGGSTGEIRNIVIEGKESGFPDDEIERAPPL